MNLLACKVGLMVLVRSATSRKTTFLSVFLLGEYFVFLRITMSKPTAVSPKYINYQG